VIDREEATEILGSDIVKSDTPEYKLASRIHEPLETVNLAYGSSEITRVRFSVISIRG